MFTGQGGPNEDNQLLSHHFLRNTSHNLLSSDVQFKSDWFLFSEENPNLLGFHLSISFFKIRFNVTDSQEEK